MLSGQIPALYDLDTQRRACRKLTGPVRAETYNGTQKVPAWPVPRLNVPSGRQHAMTVRYEDMPSRFPR